MPRCGCSGSSCSCLVVSGPGATVTGVGSSDQPYSISTAPLYEEWIETGVTYRLDTGGNPNSVFFIDSQATDIYINLPGTSSVPQLPPPGSRIEVFVNGNSGMNVYFDVHPTFFVPPGADKRGWYSLVLLQETWVGRFVVWP